MICDECKEWCQCKHTVNSTEENKCTREKKNIEVKKGNTVKQK